MNKKIVYISTLATTGIIALTSLAGTVNAATSLGSYRDLVKGISSDKVAPYVLKDNKDKLTIADIKKDFNITTFNNSSTVNNDTVVKTGDTFKANNETYEVIVYGDISSKDGKTKADGKVSSADANLMLKLAVARDKSALVNNTNLEAADIVNDGKINSDDANLALKFAVGKGTIDVKLTPEEEEKTNYDCTVAVNGNSIINNVNQGATKVVVTPKTTGTFEDGKTYTIEVLDEKGKALSTPITKEFSGDKNEISHTEELSLSDLVDGKQYIVRVRVGKKIVGEEKINVHKDTTKMESVNAKVQRSGSYDAAIELESPVDAKIVKVYCAKSVKGADNVAKIKDIVETQKINPYTVSNGKISRTVFTDGTLLETATKVYYVLEDVNGNRVLKEVQLEAHDAKADTTITNILANPTANEFDISLSKNLEAARTVFVTLYKNETEVIHTEAITNKTTNSITTEQMEDKIKENGIGTYTVKAYVNATEDSKPSPEVNSADTEDDEGKVIVSKLAKIQEVNVDVEEGKITWKDDANKNVRGLVYDIEVLRPKKDGTTYTGEYTTIDGETDVTDLTITGGKTNITTKTVSFSGADKDTSYKVRVIAKCSDVRKLPSEGLESAEFFEITAPTVPSSTATPAATLSTIEEGVKFTGITKLEEIKGKKNAQISYAVEIYEVTNQVVLKETRPVTLTKTKGKTTYETVINGLVAGKDYQFVLQVIESNKVVAQTATKTEVVTIPEKAREIKGFTVRTTATEPKEKEIYVNSNTAYINGEDFTDKVDKFSEDYQAILTEIVGALDDGDMITIDGDNVTVRLKNGSANKDLDFGNAIENKNVEIIGNSYEREITVAKAPANVKLSSVSNTEVGTFNIQTALTVKDGGKVELNGVKLKSEKGTYYSTATKLNIINGVQYQTSKETVVEPTDGKLTITASDSEVVVTTSKAVNVDFKQNTEHGLEQTGKVTIDARLASKGSVTLTSSAAKVSGELVVIGENAIIGMAQPTFTGTKNVQVINNAEASTPEETTVTAYLGKKVGFSCTALKVTKVIEDYDEENDTFKTADNNSALTLEADVTAKDVVTFLKGLNVSKYDEDTTVAVDTNGIMTLVVKGNITQTENYKVPYLNK